MEGAQAGLSWSIVLAKRDAYQAAFRNFDINYCAGLSDADLENIKENYGVIKHFAKIKSVRSNAQAVLEIQKEFGTFADFLWSYVDGEPILNAWEHQSQMPAESPLSTRISKALKKRGFKFVGPVTTYSFLQAIGMVDDHVRTCEFHTLNR